MADDKKKNKKGQRATKGRSKYILAHYANLKAYERQVEMLYHRAIDYAVAAGLETGYTYAGRPFRFEDYPLAKRKMRQLYQWLAKGITSTIAEAVRREWDRANDAADEVAFGAVGDSKALPENSRQRYYGRNDQALQAFLNRKTDGLRLSDRVWNYTNQWKEEIELGLNLGIRTGRSADEMSRDMRGFLQDPDRLFRTVKKGEDENGNPIVGLSDAAEDFHPGTGVYRSSYKNALRLTTTETNIAYRTADHDRMQRFDFIRGVQVRISNNHPQTDMCNELSGQSPDDPRGRYPKDFKFTGWHPFCRCYVVPILVSKEEMRLHKEAALRGEVYGYQQQRVEKPNEYFNQWVRDNGDRIGRAKQLPYFLRDNTQYMEEALKGGEK